MLYLPSTPVQTQQTVKLRRAFDALPLMDRCFFYILSLYSCRCNPFNEILLKEHEDDGCRDN